VQLAPVAPVAVGADTAALLELERGWSAFYLGAMGDYYAIAARRMGFGGVVDGVRTARRAGDRSAAHRAVTDDYVHSIGLFGTAAGIARRLRRYEDVGIDEVVFELRKKDLADQVEDLVALGKAVA